MTADKDTTEKTPKAKEEKPVTPEATPDKASVVSKDEKPAAPDKANAVVAKTDTPTKTAVASTTKTTTATKTKAASGPMKRRTRKTEYGLQLAEKQTAKKTYGIRERQFRNYYNKAFGQTGDTGDILRQLIQMRLDNVVYQSGFTKTRRQARQMVSHNFFLVNGKKVNIPSYQVKPKDIITIKPEKTKSKIFNEEWEKEVAERDAPSWINFDKKNKTAKILNKPVDNDLDESFSTRLIVEFYSK